MGGKCAICDQTTELLCARCKTTHYCHKSHQKRHWAEHKITCMPKTMQEDELHFQIDVNLDIPVQFHQNEGFPYIHPQARVTSILVDLEGNWKESTWRVFHTFGEHDIPEALHQTTLLPYNCTLYQFFKDLFLTETEERMKQAKRWMGGVDTSHVYYEGGYPPNIDWGS